MYTFRKGEKLRNFGIIRSLFEQGHSFYEYPFKVYYMLINERSEKYPAQVLFSVSKKRFKKAVDRNRIKRLIREAYRLNKASLYEFIDNDKAMLIIGIVYTGKDMPVYNETESKIILILRRLMKEYEKLTK